MPTHNRLLVTDNVAVFPHTVAYFRFISQRKALAEVSDPFRAKCSFNSLRICRDILIVRDGVNFGSYVNS